MPERTRKLINLLGLCLVLALYLAYVAFIVSKDQGPVDYETFMRIGQRLLRGEEVYGPNSYYPMPFVMVFALFAWLPRPLSMALWLLLPVLAALIITRWQTWVLLYAPMFAHFLGGQTAVFGLVGLWGYRSRQEPERASGGIWLALTLLKPQLGVIPVIWALTRWWGYWKAQRRIPRQAWAWLGSVLVLYVPGFFILPDWPLRWLSSPRPLFVRALSGFIPRTLILLLQPGVVYWLVWAVLSAGLLLLVWKVKRSSPGFDQLNLWYFVVSPLVHDYDLIQLIPLLERPALQWGAVLLSIPAWLVILFAYSNDAAWYAVTLIAPGLLALSLWLQRKSL